MPKSASTLRTAAVALLSATTLFVSACGAPVSAPTESADATSDEATHASEVYQKFAAMAEPQRTEELVKAAQEEGHLSLYGSQNLKDYGDAFQEKYGIEVTLLDVDNETMVSRVTQEAQAGRYTVDYVDGASNLMDALENEGLLGFYDSPSRQQIPEELNGENWTGQRRQPYLASYNYDKVDPADIPTDYLDFADPKWKGIISMEQGDYDWYMAMVDYYLAQGMSQEEIDDAFTKIASNARIANGHSDQVQLLAAGQFGVALSTYYHHVEGAIEDGAPVTWGGDGRPIVQPIIMRLNGMAIMSHAPNPAAATLFLDFILSDEGQEISRSLKELPVMPSETGDPLDGIETFLVDSTQYAEEGPEWAKKYDELLRNAAA